MSASLLSLIMDSRSRGELLQAQRKITERLEALDQQLIKETSISIMRANLIAEIQASPAAQQEFIYSAAPSAAFEGPRGVGKSWALGRAILAWALEANHEGPPRHALLLYQEASPFLGQVLDLAEKCGTTAAWEAPWLDLPNGARIIIFGCAPRPGESMGDVRLRLDFLIQGRTHGFLAVENGVNEAFVELAQRRLRDHGHGLPRTRRVVLTSIPAKCSGYYDDDVGSAPCTSKAGCGLQLCPSYDNVNAMAARAKT